MHNSATDETVLFKCKAWLDATSGDGRIERLFYPLVDCSYKVELQTSDLRGAGTSANGVISLIGKLAEAGPIQLVNDGSSFQRGSLDVMTLDELPDVGPIQQVMSLVCWLIVVQWGPHRDPLGIQQTEVSGLLTKSLIHSVLNCDVGSNTFLTGETTSSMVYSLIPFPARTKQCMGSLDLHNLNSIRSNADVSLLPGN